MRRILPRIASVILAAERFGNPLQIAWKRIFAEPDDLMTVVDRATGVRCKCSLASHHMFGDTWYARVYDVPGVPIRPGDVVLDIGANQGFFTCYAAQRGARVYAFEPVPELFERLQSNVERNGFKKQVTAVQCAVGNVDGQVEMFVSASLGGAQSTIQAEFAKNAGVPISRSIRVRCMTLPQIFAEYSISLVRECKIDAEGSELAILRTLTPAYLEGIESFAMEYHTNHYDLGSLVRLATDWGTHQVSFMDERPHTGNIMRMASTRALRGEAKKN
jgi:FkbM family methyltransferase